MAGDVTVTAKVSGLQQLGEALRGFADKLRVSTIRNALAAGGRVFRDEAKRLAPVLRVPVRRRGGALRRKPGTVRDAIKVRTSKVARRQGDVGVYVNVKPAKKGQAGANSPNDPFYWRWLEFGRSGHVKGSRSTYFTRGRVKSRRHGRSSGPMAPQRFLQRAAGKYMEALAKIKTSLGGAIARMNTRGSAP